MPTPVHLYYKQSSGAAVDVVCALDCLLTHMMSWELWPCELGYSG